MDTYKNLHSSVLPSLGVWINYRPGFGALNSKEAGRWEAVFLSTLGRGLCTMRNAGCTASARALIPGQAWALSRHRATIVTAHRSL